MGEKTLVLDCMKGRGIVLTHKGLGYIQLATIAGFSLFYAWYLMTFFGAFLFFPTGANFFDRHLSQIIYFLGAVSGSEILLIIFRRKGESDISYTPALFAVMAAMGMLLPICILMDSLGASVPLPLVWISCLFAGSALSTGFSWWDDVPKRGRIGTGSFGRGIVFGLGGLIFLGCQLCLTPFLFSVACLTWIGISVFLFTFISTRSKPAEDYPVQDAVAFFAKARALDVLTALVTVPFGFAFMLLYFYIGQGIVVVFAVMVAVDFLTTMVVGKNRIIPFAGVLRICMAFIAVGLIASVMPHTETKAIAFGFISVIWFVYRTFNGSALLQVSLVRRMSLPYTVVRGKLASNVGFLAGLGVGVCTALANDPAVVNMVTLALVIMVVLGALFLLPFDNDFNPAFRTLKPVELNMSEPPEYDRNRERCDQMIERYRLSPRESEVLMLIVRGRNAKYVAEHLFISESTAKTHIASIYRKTNVHSQQMLLDLLDEL